MLYFLPAPPPPGPPIIIITGPPPPPPRSPPPGGGPAPTFIWTFPPGPPGPNGPAGVSPLLPNDHVRDTRAFRLTMPGPRPKLRPTVGVPGAGARLKQLKPLV